MLKLALILSTLYYMRNVQAQAIGPCNTYECSIHPRPQKIYFSNPKEHKEYVPAPIGQIPSCAPPGQRYCEFIDNYPDEIINRLLSKPSVSIKDFIMDEDPAIHSSTKLLVLRPKIVEQTTTTYQPAAFEGYDYSKPKVPAQLYPTTFSKRVIKENNTVSYYPSKTLNNYQTQIFERPIPVYTSARFNPFYRERFLTQRKKRLTKESLSTLYLCPVKTSRLMPRVGLDLKGQWLYIVNAPNGTNYTQTIVSEICENEICNDICQLPLGYTCKCEQNYVQKRLVSLEPTGNRLVNEIYLFPHGCSSKILLNEYDSRPLIK
ncbi:protein spaetzle 5 isoform X1 [Trichogramma pretiosum]|uniref:protein spaetzle 5 isoform X1 n=1 Tax=Trichogramma pretiosum TaxID=7493 RepID=UPI0006C96048|nr:protein spaetzle 5 isoform X1 [Trichogramma pretiosum]